MKFAGLKSLRKSKPKPDCPDRLSDAPAGCRVCMAGFAPEVLLDDAVVLHEAARSAGVASTLEIWDDMIHVWHAFHPMLPEGKQGIVRIGEYLGSQWRTL